MSTLLPSITGPGPLALFVEHWGYGAVVLIVILGSIGLPVPEETILSLAGYLVWRGDLSLWLVLLAGIASASIGDNIGYWLGRRVGGAALRRHWMRWGLPLATLEASHRFVLNYGAAAIFAARFVPGLRFAAGPVSGLAGMRAPIFFVANVLGAACYVPVVVGVGYGIGRGFGPGLERIHPPAIAIEYMVLIAALIGTLFVLLMRVRAAHR